MPDTGVQHMFEICQLPMTYGSGVSVVYVVVGLEDLNLVLPVGARFVFKFGSRQSNARGEEDEAALEVRRTE